MPSITLQDNSPLKWNSALVMGIINATPDSYYLSSTDPLTNLALAESMMEQGADILDIGAMSSRPGAEISEATEEWKSLEPHLTLIRKKLPQALISVDTVHASVAQQAIDAGADMINDISFGKIDPEIWSVVRACEVPYVGMHMQGTPATMQDAPSYAQVVTEVYEELEERWRLSQIASDKILLDLGIGFGKTIDHNFELIAGLSQFSQLGVPIVLGVSRKSLLYKLLDSTPHQMLSASSALHMYALLQGADVLRVHDVQETRQVIQILNQINKSKNL